MPNKEDLRRRNRELRHQNLINKRKQKVKEQERKAEIQKKKEVADKAPEKSYPALILTMLKRVKYIEPNKTVAGMDPHQAALISYFKLKQGGFENLKLGVSAMHAWVEFEYQEKWWIFDPVAVKKKELGLPIKRKLDTEEPQYSSLSRYYTDVDRYIEIYTNYIDLTKDECKIAAMEDPGLNQTLRINYH